MWHSDDLFVVLDFQSLQRVLSFLQSIGVLFATYDHWFTVNSQFLRYHVHHFLHPRTRLHYHFDNVPVLEVFWTILNLPTKTFIFINKRILKLLSDDDELENRYYKIMKKSPLLKFTSARIQKVKDSQRKTVLKRLLKKG